MHQSLDFEIAFLNSWYHFMGFQVTLIQSSSEDLFFITSAKRHAGTFSCESRILSGSQILRAGEKIDIIFNHLAVRNHLDLSINVK